MNHQPTVKNPVTYLFAKPSAFTLLCSLAAMTIFSLLRTLVATFDAYRLRELTAIYYFAGDSSLAVVLVNLVLGLIGCAILFWGCRGMAGAVFAIRNNHEQQLPQALKHLLISLIASIFFTSIMIVCALASSSLINYRAVSAFSANQSGDNASSLFLATVLFGSLFLTTEITLTRLVMAMERTLKHHVPEKQGATLGIIIASVSSGIMVITFLVALITLVLPDTSSNRQMNFAGDLAMNTVHVLLAAAACVFFITLIIVVSLYATAAEEKKAEKQKNTIYGSLFETEPAPAYQPYTRTTKVFQGSPDGNETPDFRLSPPSESSRTEYPAPLTEKKGNENEYVQTI